MKKLLKVSMIAMLVAAPMVARADNEPVDANNPLYAGVDATAVADVASTSYVKGAYNDAIGKINKVANLKQDKLMNNAASPAAITGPVQTSIRATGTASDTALATEKAVRDAIDSTAGAVGDLSTLAGDFGVGDTGNTAPATVVAALDGLDDRVDTLETTVGTTALVTGNGAGDLAATTVTAAINELQSDKQEKADSTVSSAGNYLTTGTGVGANLQALDTAVGKLSAAGNYTVVANSAAQNIAAVDTAVGNVVSGTTNIAYDHTASGLSATTVKGAIDEIATTAGSALKATDLDGTTIELDGTSGKVQVVDGSIGATQLDTAVNTSLGLADTALQAGTAASNGTVDLTKSDYTAGTIGAALYNINQTANTAKYVTVHTTWNSDNTVASANVITTTAP